MRRKENRRREACQVKVSGDVVGESPSPGSAARTGLNPRREIGAGERKELSLSSASRGITNSYKQLICRKRNESKFMLPMLNI